MVAIEEDHQSLLQPLIDRKPIKTDHDTTSDHSTPNAAIFIRFISVILVGILSFWANHEASKGFDITVLNNLPPDSPAGHRFNLFYVANDKLTRIVLRASDVIEHLLYPNDHDVILPKKQINSVVVSMNLTKELDFVVEDNRNFVMNISPSVMEEADVERALVSVIRRGMARVWLWDGRGSGAPVELVEGMVEYVSMAAEGFGGLEGGFYGRDLPAGVIWWEEKDPVAVAKLLRYYEGYSKGFIQRLNRDMKEKWHDRKVDDALSMSIRNMCDGYNVTKASY